MSDEEFKDAEEGVVPMESRPPAPPLSHSMTAAMGLNTHRLQVMKASFFGAGERVSVRGEEGRRMGGKSWQPSRVSYGGRGVGTLLAKSSNQGGMEPRLGRVQFQDTPSPIPHLPPDSTPHSLRHLRQQATPLPTPSRSLMEFAGDDSLLPHPSSTSVLTTDLSTSSLHSAHAGYKLCPHAPPPPSASAMQLQSVVIARSDLTTLVPMSESMAQGRSRLVADAGLFLGHSFRVGWGPNWTLSHSGSPIHSGSGMRPGNSLIQVTIEKVFPTPFMVNAPPQKISVSSKIMSKAFIKIFCFQIFSHFLSPTWLPSWNTVR